MIALLLAAMPTVLGTGQDPRVLAGVLGKGHVVATAAGVAAFVAAAADGSAIAVVDHQERKAIVLGSDGAVQVAPRAGAVRSIALLPNGRGCWLGLDNGSVVHASADGEPRSFGNICSGAIDGISCVAGRVAWSSAAEDRGGVLDARDGTSCFAADARYGNGGMPRMLLSRDGRDAFYVVRDPESGGRRRVLVVDVGQEGDRRRFLGFRQGDVAAVAQ